MEVDGHQYEETHRAIKKSITEVMRDIDSGSEGEEPTTDENGSASRFEMRPRLDPLVSGKWMMGKQFIIQNVRRPNQPQTIEDTFSVDRNMKDMLLIQEEMQAKWNLYGNECKPLALKVSYEENMKEFRRLRDEMPEVISDVDNAVTTTSSYGTPIYDNGRRVGTTFPSFDFDID